MSYPTDARMRWQEVSVTNDIATTEEIPFGFARSGVVVVPTGSSLTTLTWWAAEKIGTTGTYKAAYDNAGTPAAVAQTVSAAKSYPIPVSNANGLTALAGAAGLKIVGNTSGTVLIGTKS